MKILNSQFCCLTALIAALASPAAMAQTQFLEEVIVSARKINETIQDAPVTVNVMTESQLQDAGVTHTGDYIQLIPNVSLAESQTAGTSFLSVRGLSRVRNGELPVAVVVDGVSIVNARQFSTQIFDLQQIEFVKGPQGAYYGRNASNGAVIITTKAPSEEPEGHIKLSYGTANETAIEGSFSAPLSDTVGVRISGRSMNRDGYFKNVTLDDDVDPLSDQALRARLTWTPSDTLSFDFKAETGKTEGKGIGFHWPGAAQFEVFGVFLGTADELGVTVDQVLAEGSNLVDVPYVANNPDRGVRETNGYSLKIDKSLSWADFTSVTTYDDLRTSSVADRAPYLSVLDGTQHSFTDVEGWSQEFRLTSNNEDNAMSWQVGAYYLSWDRLRTTVTGIDTGLGIKRPTTVPEFENSTNPTGLDPGNFLSFVEDSSDWAVFASVNWELTDRLDLSLAGRYDKETREQIVNPYNNLGLLYSVADSNGVNQPYAGSACDEDTAGEVANVNCGRYDTFSDLLANTDPRSKKNEKTFSKFQPKITLAYEATDNINVFANWGIGYRAGQFNYPGIGSISPTSRAVTDQEENTVFEIGAKAEFDTMRFSVAWFSSDVDNTQYFPFDGLAFTQIFEDIDEAELDGFELEASWRPTDGLNLYAAYGTTNSEIKAYTERPTTIGNDLPYVPEETINIGAQYDFGISGNINGFVRVDYERRGEQFWTPENSFPREDLNLVNLRVGMEGDSWSSSIYVNNLSDKKYNSEVVTPLFLHPAAPRVVRWDIRYNF